MQWLGVDTGGTFTDFVLWTGTGLRIHKVSSTPAAPERAILQGVHEMGLDELLSSGELVIVHGTTVATNAALERKGARTLFITNEGLEDVLLIGRQARAELYNLTPAASAGLPQTTFLGVDSRVAADGSVLRRLDEALLASLREQVTAMAPEAIAINLLFDFLNDEDECRIAEVLQDSGAFVCRAGDVLPLAGEYERGMAVWLNAWLGPRVEEYLSRLRNSVGECSLSVMQSHGGTLDAEVAARRAVNLLLSGPAGGLCAAREVGLGLGEHKLMTFDMGGTSTDVALIEGDLRLTTEGRIGPWPVAVPMIDMHTIGAGGGSLAYVDEAGLLHVGPESAGADPGPACYGRGGSQLTVTDANLLAGRLQPDFALGGSLALDADAAARAADALAAQLGLSREDTVAGVLALANEHMAQALRVISVEKGHDPTEFVLLSFGGAGGLHVCDLAEMLSMQRALVPRNSGVLSAQGMLQAQPQRELVKALPQGADAQTVDRLAAGLLAQGASALEQEGVAPGQVRSQVTLELCYRGQSFTLPVPWDGDMAAAVALFHALHEKRYGHALGLPVQAINVCVRVFASGHALGLPAVQEASAGPCATAAVMGERQPVPVYRREALGRGQQFAGPALIVEPVATTCVKDGWRVEVTTAGHLYLSVQADCHQ